MADTSYGNKYEDDSSDVEPMDVDCGSSKIASADEAGSSGGSSKKRHAVDDEYASSAVRSKVPKVIEDYEALKKELEEERRRRVAAEEKAVTAEEKAVEERRLRETAEEKAVEERRLREEERRRNFMTTVDYLIEELRQLPTCKDSSSTSGSNAASSHWNEKATLKSSISQMETEYFSWKGGDMDMASRTSVILGTANNQSNNGAIVWCSENDIASLVKGVVADVKLYLGFKSVEIQSEVEVVGLRPDIWLLFSVRDQYRIPFAVLEVKKPDLRYEKAQMDNEHFAGQIYSYLRMLKEVWGIQNPIGIMSTYRYWRVCTLGEDDWETLGKKEHPTSFTLHTCEFLTVADETENDNITDSDDDSNMVEERLLYCTKPVHYQDPEVIVLLVNALWRAVRAEQKTADPRTAELVIRFGASTGICTWHPNPWKSKSVDFNRACMPRKDCSVFYLIQDLRFGAHGKVWVAASLSGRVCVLKLASLYPPGNQERMEKEKMLWCLMLSSVKNSIRVLECGGGRIALVIPFCRPLTEDERKTEVTRNGIMENITKLLQQGWDHGDLIHFGDDKKTFKWHHIGIFKQNQLCLLDFGAAKRIKPEEVDDYKQMYRAVLFPEANPLSV